MPLVSVTDYRRYAKDHIRQNFWNFIEGGATEQLTVADNVAAYRRYRLLPTHLVDVSGFKPEVNVFGKTYATPVGISPSAFHKMAHSGGEKETVRAAQNANTVFIHSADSSTTIEEVALAGPNVTKWQMIQGWPIQNFTLSLIKKAEAAGYDGFVVTVDDTAGRIRSDVMKGIARPVTAEIRPVLLEEYFDGTPIPDVLSQLRTGADTWDDIEWIMQQTQLPVILKGVLSPDVAKRAVAVGASGIIVSNHGGR